MPPRRLVSPFLLGPLKPRRGRLCFAFRLVCYPARAFLYLSGRARVSAPGPSGGRAKGARGLGKLRRARALSLRRALLTRDAAQLAAARAPPHCAPGYRAFLVINARRVNHCSRSCYAANSPGIAGSPFSAVARPNCTCQNIARNGSFVTFSAPEITYVGTDAVLCSLQLLSFFLPGTVRCC